MLAHLPPRFPAACLIMILVLAGCATTTPTSSPQQRSSSTAPVPTAPTQDTESVPAAEQPAPRPEADASIATLALLKQSERAASNGSLNEAISYAERAVRINPRQADLWNRLAALELDNQHPQTAIQYATKALSLASARLDWQRDAWLLIASAKDALGEHREAEQIRERWRSVRG